jgi:transposase
MCLLINKRKERFTGLFSRTLGTCSKLNVKNEPFVREWTCLNCGFLDDRNLNAGTNILNVILKLVA